MTDHKAEATKAIGSVHEETAPEWSAVWATEAQAHATLYLAEQQRIANVIALAHLEEVGGGTERTTWDSLFEMTGTGFSRSSVVRQPFRDGLGIA